MRDELAASLKSGSSERLLRICHTLAGTGGTIGYDDITTYGRAVETALRAERPVRSVAGDCRRLLVEIDAALSQHGVTASSAGGGESV
jgi:HPt (histidine-containing phosphotransfer) domain-containing protein